MTNNIEAPRFNGYDPASWVYKVQAYFDYFHTTANDRLQLVGLLFDNPALEWFRYQRRYNFIRTWEEVLDAVQQKFNGGSINSHVQDRTLLVKIHSMVYRISCDVLASVFSRFGTLEDAEILNAETGFHSRIRFTDRESAIDAFNALNGRNIYDGCCQLELFLDVLSEIEAPMAYTSSGPNQVEPPIEDVNQIAEVKPVDQLAASFRETASHWNSAPRRNWNSSGYKPGGQSQPTRTLPAVPATAPLDQHPNNLKATPDDAPQFENDVELQSQDPEIAIPVSVETHVASKVFDRMPKGFVVDLDEKQGASSECVMDSSLQEQFTVNSKPVEVVDCDAPEKVVVSVVELNDPGGIKVGDLKGHPFEFLAISTAQQLFAKMPMRNSIGSDFSIHPTNVPLLMDHWVFDPGSTAIAKCRYRSNFNGLPGQFECFYLDTFDGQTRHSVQQLNFGGIKLTSPTGGILGVIAATYLLHFYAAQTEIYKCTVLLALCAGEIIFKHLLFDPGIEISEDGGFSLLVEGSYCDFELLVFDSGGSCLQQWGLRVMGIAQGERHTFPLHIGRLDKLPQCNIHLAWEFQSSLLMCTKNVDKKVLVQWLTQLSYAFGGFTSDKFSMRLSWGKVPLSNGNDGGSKCNMGDEVFLMPSESFVYGLTLHYSGEAAPLDDVFANTRCLWDPGDHWLLLSTHCCWALSGLNCVFDPGGTHYGSTDDAWAPYDKLRASFPDFRLEDKSILNGGVIDT